MASTGSTMDDTSFHHGQCGHRCRPPMPVIAACATPIRRDAQRIEAVRAVAQRKRR